MIAQSMTAEYGHFALILAFCLSLALSVLPLLGAATNNRLWIASARPLAIGQAVFSAISFACLVVLFLNDDFSVNYVAANSNRLLPDYYKVSAVWGAHEGSLLLWVLILTLWTAAVAVYSRALPNRLVSRVLSVMGIISVGFFLFVLLTSNPFERSLPFFPPEGADLNPLLQDIGLILHPPMLYMGYVGFSVAFAFAIAALLDGRMDTAWARWMRPWTNTAWAFLTLGITLGSWWAYYELGWGGWWFWDPVENASFMPWLVGTALVHSLAVTEKRGVFRSWTLLLAIFAFSLSLLGTFLVRSGVLTSVHAFAADPERGVFILAFLAIVVGGSLFLYALRGPTVKGVATFTGLSREMFLLINNLILVVATAIILLGTLYPLIADVLDWGKLSVGPPYFNFFFVPLMLLLAVALGAGQVMRWKRTDAPVLRTMLQLPIVVSVVSGALLPLLLPVFLTGSSFSLSDYSIVTGIALMVAIWIAVVTFRDLFNKTRMASSVADRVQKLTRLKPAYYGMVMAHLGVAVCIAGVAVTTQYSVQRDVRLEPGQSVSLSGYDFTFDGVRQVRGANYIADQGPVSVSQDGKSLSVLKPEKRRYLASGQIMTEADIDAGFWRDIYIALGEPLAGDAWAVRVYVKPLVRWIWLGGVMICLGGLLAIMDRRYRRVRVTDNASAAINVGKMT
jgi:cytochrome c-type biogenesis protein CcmF